MSRHNPVQRARAEKSKEQNLASLKGKETNTMASAALVPVDRPLTEMQKLFVKSWAEGDSIPNAMQRAGYNEQPSYGYRMAKMPNILAEYSKIKALWEDAAQMTRKKVMDMHLEAFEMAKLMAEPATMVSAAREIGRMCGYYEPVKQKIEISINGQVQAKRLESMSDEELLKMVMDGVQMAGGQAPQAQQALEMAPGDDFEHDPGV